MTDGITVDLRQIDKAVRTIEKELGIPIRDVVNKIGLDLWGDVTRLSPVHTGRYRAAWNLNENTPDLSTPAASPGANSVAAPSQPATANGLYPVLFLSNALPYAVKIEEGHSHTKAPDGVLKVALAGRQLL
jgi:hypothetical protein